MKSRFFAGLSLAALAVTGSTAFAQETAAPGETEEIVVTAQKRAENIQSVPLSVSALGAEQLRSYHATRLSDFSAYVPGFQVEQGSGRPGEMSLTLRGISTAASKNSTVATLVDDIPIGSSSSFVAAGIIGPDLFPFDMARIEVLAGPQGTLYGASSMGGLLKYVTRTPDVNDAEFTIGSSISVIHNGNDIGRSLHGSANIPIVPGKLALSISGAAEHTPGFIDNVALGKRAYNDGLQAGGRIALNWTPSDRFALKLGVIKDYSKFNGRGTISTNQVGHDIVETRGRYENFAVLPQRSRRNFMLYSANASYDFGWATLTSITGYTVSRHQGIEDSSLGFSFLRVLVPVDQNYNIDKLTQEVRLASPDTQRLEWVLGAFYTKEDGEFSLNAGALDPATRAPAAGMNPLYFDRVVSRFEEMAAFANGTFNITEKWDVSAGLRLSRNKQRADESTTGALIGGGTILTSFLPASENVTTYSLGTGYRFSPDVMVYGRIATGYRPGGLNQTSPLPNYPLTYDADTLTNYEIGLKAQFFDRRMLLNITAFHIDWNDIQVGQSNGVFSFLDNTGKATSDGVEFTTSYRITPELKLGVTAAYTDAKLAEDQPASGGFKGDPLPGSPRFSDAVSLDYSRRIGSDYNLKLGAIWRYVGKRTTYFRNSPLSVDLSDYHVVDLTAGLGRGPWNATLFVRNLANTRPILSYYSFGAESTILQPRVVGVSLDAQF